MKIIIIKIFLYMSAYLPLPLSHGLGFLAGWCLFLFPSHSRRITQINLGLCLPALSASEQRKLVRKSLIEICKTIFEIGALWLRPGKSTLRLIKKVQGSELVDVAMATGKGVILATPHQGAWEAAGLFCGAHYQINCLYRPLKMHQLDALVTRARGRMGGHFLPADTSGIRALLKNSNRVKLSPCCPTRNHSEALEYSLRSSGSRLTAWSFLADWQKNPVHRSFLSGANACHGVVVITCSSARHRPAYTQQTQPRQQVLSIRSSKTVRAPTLRNTSGATGASAGVPKESGSITNEQRLACVEGLVHTSQKDFHFLCSLYIAVTLCSTNTGFKRQLRLFKISNSL